MQLALIWILSLAASGLLLAVALLLPARLGWRVVGAIVGLFVGLPPLAVAAAGTWISARIHATGVEPCRLAFFGSWLAADALLVAVLLLRGLRRAKADPRHLAARSWSWKVILPLAVAAIFLLGAALLWLDSSRKDEAERIVDENKAALRSLAIPDLPAEKNAAPLYEKARELAGRSSMWPEWMANWSAGLPDPDVGMEEVGRFLGEHREALRLVRQAARLPAAWKADREDALDLTLPIIGMRDLLSLLSLDLRWKATKGDVPGVLEDLEAMDGMLDQTFRVPSLVDSFVAGGYWTSVVVPTHEYLTTRLSDFPVLERLRRLRRIPFADLVRHASTFEEAFARANLMFLWSDAVVSFEGLDSFLGLDYGPRRYFHEVLLARPTGRALWRLFYLPAELESLREGHETWRAIAARPYGEAQGPLKAFGRSPRNSLFWMFSGIPALTKWLERAADLETRQEIFRAGLAAAAFRRAKGRYSQSWSDLVPEFLEKVPADPSGRGAIELSPSPGGLTIGWRSAPDSERTFDFALGSAYEEKLRRAAEEAKRYAGREEPDEE